MREIKFRAWSNDLGMSETTTLLDLIRYQTDFDEFEIYLQYTGLKDKNGTELYEGDIVTEGVFNYIIKWFDFGFWKVQVGASDDYKTMLCGIDNYTKLGNIYENPELLEV